MRPDAVEMVLTYAEMLTCTQQGMIRTLESIYKGRKRRAHMPDEDAFGADARGAASEYAVARYTRLPWHLAIRRFGEPDVGDNVHVRGTRHLSGHLVLRDDDTKLDEPYVLVVGPYPNLIIVGWAFGKEVQIDKYRREDAWWAPPLDLRSITTLSQYALPRFEGPDF